MFQIRVATLARYAGKGDRSPSLSLSLSSRSLILRDGSTLGTRQQLRVVPMCSSDGCSFVHERVAHLAKKAVEIPTES